MCRRLFATLLLAVSCSAPGLAGAGVTNDSPAGVVVEEVGSGSAGERAGIKPGDVLLSWVRLSNPPANPKEARGKIESPFDLTDVEIEQAPRGEVKLSGRRSGKAFSVSVPPGEWKIQVRPQMSGKTLAIYQDGKKLIEVKEEPDKGLELWRQLAQEARQEKNGKTASWLYLKTSNVLADLRRWDEAHAAYRAAIEEAKSAPGAWMLTQIWTANGRAFQAHNDFPKAELAYSNALGILQRQSSQSLGVAGSLNNLGGVAEDRGDLSAAEDFYRKALAIRERLAPGSLSVAATLNNLGTVAGRRGDLAAAEDFFRKALAIREKLAPGSLDVATSLNNLGIVALYRADLAAAEDFHGKALAIDEKLAPGSLDVALSLKRLGNVGWSRGDLAAAEGFYRKALAIQEKLAPGSLAVADSLHNLGNVAYSRGDLAAAEDFYRKSLAIKEKFAPGSLAVAGSLHNLGNVAYSRDDLAAAEDFYGKDLAITEKLAPGSLDVAASLTNLGIVAYHRGDLAAAEDFYGKALAIDEKLAPGSLAVAATLLNLGEVAKDRGDPAAAEDFYRKALAIHDKLAPRSLDVAASLSNLREVAKGRGDLAAAEDLDRKALAIYERLSPGSTNEAAAFHDLGTICRKSGRRADAADFFRRAIESLENQKGKLGGSEQVKAGFGAKYVDYYREYIEILLELNKQNDAFGVLERSKARTLLSMLAERDLVFSSDVPGELERERKLTDAEYDRAQSRIGKLNPQKDAQKLDELLGKLRELRTKQDEIAEKIKKASPKLASLQYPQPLDLAETQKALDPGTVLLAYSVGKEKSFLFVVQPKQNNGFSVFPLAIGEKTLRESVEAFRNLIDWKTPPGQGPPANLLIRSRSLYDTLIKPAEKLIEKSDRILILPDGPLYIFPFDALIKDVKADKPQYLVEWKPLHTAVSATVYAELKKERRTIPSSSAVVVAAFGDPKYPKLPQKTPAAKRGEDEKPDEAVETPDEDQAADPEVREAVRGGYRLDPLPATRQEVESIAALYAPKAVKYLGEDATEEKAKALGKDTPFIHFACHGMLNERFPLDSALALTIPEKPKQGQDNGLLQAWEIFEKVRIDADLVTLSACETGLGKEMGGEGLVGLTRAFQYAGARSILASLWKVEDESTGELMKRFYGYLKGGKTKDEALRLAQVELIHSPNLAQPVHWAAFQLIGDWK